MSFIFHVDVIPLIKNYLPSTTQRPLFTIIPLYARLQIVCVCACVSMANLSLFILAFSILRYTKIKKREHAVVHICAKIHPNPYIQCVDLALIYIQYRNNYYESIKNKIACHRDIKKKERRFHQKSTNPLLRICNNYFCFSCCLYYI